VSWQKILKGNGIEIGQNRLFEKLRQDGYLIKRKGTDYNAPNQRRWIWGFSGSRKPPSLIQTVMSPSVKQPRLQARGKQYFINLFLGKGVNENEH
jgi:anti-repressor protein